VVRVKGLLPIDRPAIVLPQLELVPGLDGAYPKKTVICVIDRHIVAALEGKESLERLNRGCLVVIGRLLPPNQIGDFVDRFLGKIDFIEPPNCNVAPIAEAFPRMRLLSRDVGG
jgi:translation initiation factor 2 gamma subunit (eIF-2gamma)